MSEKQVSAKDIHDLIWQCRDLEIENLWKRSTLLATFLVIFWTGLGYTFYKFIDLCIDKDSVFSLTTNIGNFFLVGIQFYCVLGSSLSLLWICMMKGSKAWVEFFEAHLCSMVAVKKQRDLFFSKDVVEKLVTEKHFPYNGYTPAVLYAKWDNSILSSKGGCFSPSRINTVIGIISFVLFSLLTFFMFVISLLFAQSILAVLLSVAVVFVYIGINYRIYSRVQSDFLHRVMSERDSGEIKS